MGKAKKKTTEPGAAESNELPTIERRSVRAKKKTTYYDHTKPEERGVPTRFSLRSRDIPPSPPYPDSSKIRLTKISEEPEPEVEAEGGIEVEGEVEEEKSPPFESFDVVSPFDYEDKLESTEEHDDPSSQAPKTKKKFVEVVESLVSPFDPKPNSSTPPPPVPAAAVDEELECLKNTVEDMEEEFNSGDLLASRLNRTTSLQSLLDQVSDTDMPHEPQNQRNNNRRVRPASALDIGDPLAVGRVIWRNLISRNNFIQTIRTMDYNNRGQNRFHKRQFTRHRLRVSTLFKKYQKMVDSLQDQLVPTQQEIEQLRAVRNREMKDLEAHSTMQVSEDMLKFQDAIRQFSEKNAAAEKVLRTELNQRESEITLLRLRRKLRAANLELLELKLKADSHAPVQQEDDIPVPNPSPRRPRTPTPELPGECPPEYEQVETISNYSDEAEDDKNQLNSSNDDQEEYHSSEDEGGSGAAPPSDTEYINPDENEHSDDHDESFLTPTGSLADDHEQESMTVDVEGSQSEMEINKLDTQKMLDQGEELDEPTSQSTDLNIGMTQSQDEGISQGGHGLSASETEAEVEDLTPSVSAIPVGNPPLALSAPWQTQTSQFFLSHSDTDTDAGTTGIIEKEKVPDVPLFSNSEQESESTQTMMSEVRHETQTNVSAKSGSGRLSESCSDVGGTVSQRKVNSCKSGSGLDVKKAKKVPPTNVGPKALQQVININSGLSNYSANLPQLSMGSGENIIPESKKRPLKTDKKIPEIPAPPGAKMLPDMSNFKAHVQRVCAHSESEHEEKMRRKSMAKSTPRDKSGFGSTPKGVGNKRRSTTLGPAFVKTSVHQIPASKHAPKNLPLQNSITNISTATSESDIEMLNRKSTRRPKVQTVLKPETDSRSFILSPGRTSPAKKTSITSPSKAASSGASGTANLNPNGPETQTQTQPQISYQQPQQQWQPQYGQQGAGAPYFDMFGYNSMMMASMFPSVAGTRPGFNMQPPGSFVPGMGPSFQGGNMGVGLGSNFPPRMAPPYAQPTSQGMNFQQQHVPNTGMSNGQQQLGAPDSGMTTNFPQQAGGSNGGMNMNNFQQPGMNPYFQQGPSAGFPQPEAGHGGKRRKGQADKNRNNTRQGQGGSQGINQNFPQQVTAPGMNPYQQGPAGMGFYQPGGMQGMNNMYQQQPGAPGMQNYQMGVPGGGAPQQPNEVPVDGTTDDSGDESE